VISRELGRDGVRQRDVISGSVLLFFAVLLFFQARKLAIWEELGPSEGFFPLCLSVVFAGLSLMIIIQALFKPVELGERTRIIAPNKRKFFAYLGLFFGFGILFPIVGYIPILAAFLVIILRPVEKLSWKTTLLLTISIIVGSNIIFVRILNISMPQGVLSSVLQLLP
jgi:putative tricarboxylic transport membrane protein